ALVGLVGEHIGWTALILQVVAEESQSAPGFLVQEHGEIPAGQANLGVASGDGRGDGRCGCQNGCRLGPAEVIREQGGEGLVLLNAVQGGLGSQILGHIDGRGCLGESSVLGVGIVNAVVGEVIQDIIGVGSSG